MTYYEDGDDYGDELPPANGKGIRIEFDETALSEIAQRAANTLQAKMEKLAIKMIEQRIDAIMNETWKKTIAERAEAAIFNYLTKPRPRTNQYGENVGASITLSDNIPIAVKAYLDEKVNAKGGSDPSYGKITRINWIVAKFVRDEIDGETRQAAAAVTEKARQVVQQHVARFISEQMVPAIEVNPK